MDWLTDLPKWCINVRRWVLSSTAHKWEAVLQPVLKCQIQNQQKLVLNVLKNRPRLSNVWIFFFPVHKVKCRSRYTTSQQLLTGIKAFWLKLAAHVTALPTSDTFLTMTCTVWYLNLKKNRYVLSGLQISIIFNFWLICWLFKIVKMLFTTS